jgi:hypothetical protein
LAARRLLVLPAAALLGYLAAVLLQPRLFLPARYLTYGLPPFLCLALPAGLSAGLRAAFGDRTPRHAGAATAIAGVLVLLVAIGGRGPGSTGLQYRTSPEARPVLRTIAGLEGPVFVAGWPFGPVDDVGYLAGKPVLVGFETHQVFHRRYADAMRDRMRALIGAYFAPDAGPLLDLRERFGVTHLLVDRRHYTDAPPPYFAPFTNETRVAAQRLHDWPEPVRLAETPANVAEHGPFVLLDLRRLSASSPDD